MAGDRDPKHRAGDQSVPQVAGNLRATRHPVVRTRSPKALERGMHRRSLADRRRTGKVPYLLSGMRRRNLADRRRTAKVPYLLSGMHRRNLADRRRTAKVL